MPVYPPPYHQKDLTLCQFVLEADAQKLQEVVDRYLNVTNAPQRFAVLGSWVLFQTGHVGSNISGVAGAMFGTGQETSATFLVPVVRWGGDGLIPIEIGLFAPFVFVDRPLSLIAGREVLGMAKQLASFLPLGGGQGGPAADLDNMTIEPMVVEKLGGTFEEVPLPWPM